jgi:hypothetical protein
MNLKNEHLTWGKVVLIGLTIYLFLLFSQNGFKLNSNNYLQASAATGAMCLFLVLALFVFVPFHLKKSNYSNLAFCIALITFSAMSILGQKGYKLTDLSLNLFGSYNDCILDHSQSLDTLIAADMVKKSCRIKYPLKLRQLNESDISSLTGGASVHRIETGKGLASFDPTQFRFKDGSINIEITNSNPSFYIKHFVVGLIDPTDKSNYQEIEVEIPERGSGKEYYFNVETRFKYTKSSDIDWFIKSASVY